MHSPRTPLWIIRLAAALAAALSLGTAGCDVTVSPSAPAGTAPTASARELDQLVVAGQGSMAGYSRDRFPHWRRTGDNCDVRDTVLTRDGEDIQYSGCNVVGGRWRSPYDGRTFTDPADLDIDHMVPLANAWRSGASGWDDSKRGDFANDLTRPQLIAVSLSSNRAKGDQDPSQWKPPSRDYWCRYARDWIAVKYFWKLSVTVAERAALADMLKTCA